MLIPEVISKSNSNSTSTSTKSIDNNDLLPLSNCPSETSSGDYPNSMKNLISQSNKGFEHNLSADSYMSQSMKSVTLSCKNQNQNLAYPQLEG